MNANPEKSGRLVFFGTPDFAVASADALHAAGMPPAAVVTAPDKPAGRGMKLQISPMKAWALKHDLPVLQPEDFLEASFLQNLKRFQAELFVIVAFRILPAEVFSMPPLGTINLHGSLLPKYRGAAPINWAIIEGETETGVTTFVIDDKVDTGNILLQRKTAIGAEETFGELYGRLKELGAALLVETVRKYTAGQISPQPQIGEATRAPKIKPEMCRIDWRAPAERIRNLVRGLCPAPAAYTTFRGRRLKVFRCRAWRESDRGAPGEILIANARAGELRVACGDGSVILEEVQLEGKKRMAAAAFLRGADLTPGDVFG